MSIHAWSDELLFASTGVRVAFIQRSGGVSVGAYDSLNVGAHVGDAIESVEENRNRILHGFEAPGCPIIVPHQIHGNHIVVYGLHDDYDSVQDRAQKGADGVAVAVADVSVMMSYADCIPLIIVSPARNFAVVHAGWRGVINGVAYEALQRLFEIDKAAHFNEFCASCNVYIGPFIQRECFEVGSDVRDTFFKAYGPSCVYQDTHVDLGIALRQSLCDRGVVSQRIAEVGQCTVCHPEAWFSYRASEGVCGRHAAFAVRKQG